MLKKLY